MGKIHNYTAIAVIIFVASMIFLIIQPMDFLNDNIEQIHQKNEGLIWIIGLILAALLLWRTYANGVYQNELKKCAIESKEKNDLISTQNDKIIKNQLTYIDEIRRLGKDINDNSKRDNETIKMVDELKISVNLLHRRIESSEKRIEKHIEKHDEFIRNIQAKS